MITVLNYVIFGSFFLIPVLLAVSIFAGVAIGGRRPFWFVIGYFLIMLYVPNSSWGLSVSSSFGFLDGIYVRGTGAFMLSFLNWGLLGLFVVVSVSRHFKKTIRAPHNLKLFIWAFLAIVVGNIFVGLGLDYKITVLLAEKGLLNLVNMFLAFAVVISLFRERKDLDTFINVFLFAAGTRALYGAVRFFAFGGDPANAYANYEKVDVKLTFFDVNDGFIATMAAFICAWRLIALHYTRESALKALYWALVGLEVFTVIFSVRRTSLIGFGMAATLFALSQPKKLRNMLFMSYVGLGIPLALAQMLKRMTTNSRTAGQSLLEQLAPDVFGGNQIGVQASRFVELQAAWDTIVHSPVVGMGIWGEYNGYGIPSLAFHNNDFTWMHSGILHIWLKSGFVGVLLFLAMWFYYGLFIRTHHKKVAYEYRGLMLASAGGALFYLPNWLVGTPVIEYRTMQLTGLLLALPYVAYTFGQRTTGRR
jgi:hypothetical protein